MYKYVCRSCGANLDPGEKCDCIAKRKETEEKDGQFAFKELIACT